MGYDLIEWLMDRLNIEESVEALHIGNLLCQYGYFFPVSDTKNLVVKDDSSLYRFQIPAYWPWHKTNKPPDNVDYSIYLVKRTLRNKQRHGLEDYEMEALASLKKNLANKWECIVLQADEQVRRAKGQKKCDKIVSDSQERAFWRVNRPPPGFLNSLEYVPVPSRNRSSKPKKRSLEDVQREVDFLRRCLDRTRIKMSVALESLMQYCDLFCEWDPLTTPPQPSNPWVSEDPTFWMLNSPIVEIPTEKRVRRWAISMEELVCDPTGLQEFTNYLRKEYSHENIRFWLAVNDLRRSSQKEIPQKVKEIFNEFLAPGAPCEVNIDGKTMERTQQELKAPSRFTFDPAAEHVYALLLKKDCYPRFRRSEMYKQLLAAGVQPSAKKRFFNFGGPGKKKAANQPQALLQQQQSTAASLSQQGSLAGRRRGSDRSLSGSAHELAVSGVRDKELNRTVSHSHSQSNLSDIPYRDPPGGSSDEGQGAGRSQADDVCPWDAGPPKAPDQAAPPGPAAGPAPSPASATAPGAAPGPGRISRKNSSQMDSGGSSSDISIAIAEVSERLRKSCCVQQHSVTGSPGSSSDGRRLMAGSRDTRRASESLVTPSVTTSVLAAAATPAAAVASAARPSVSSTEDLATPQRSFDSATAPLSRSLAEEAAEPPASPTPATPAPAPAPPPPTAKTEDEAADAVPRAEPAAGDLAAKESRETKFEDRAQQTGPELSRPKKSKKQPSLGDDPSHSAAARTSKKGVRKKSSSSATPLISVSSVADDTFDNSDAPAAAASPRTAVAAPADAEPPSSAEAEDAADTLVAPLAQQEDESTAPPSPSAGPAAPPGPSGSSAPPGPSTSSAPQGPRPQGQGARHAGPPLGASRSEDRASVERGSSTEGKANEICPWEDEESCKVDEPFTKKYSHFGYL